jgi:hypothetical protein
MKQGSALYTVATEQIPDDGASGFPFLPATLLLTPLTNVPPAAESLSPETAVTLVSLKAFVWVEWPDHSQEMHEVFRRKRRTCS